MRTRWGVLVLSPVTMTALLGIPAAANPDSSKYAGVTSKQFTEFESVAANASESSNAPQGFAPCVNGMAADTFPVRRRRSDELYPAR